MVRLIGKTYQFIAVEDMGVVTFTMNLVFIESLSFNLSSMLYPNFDCLPWKTMLHFIMHTYVKLKLNIQ